jgi:hypothetical protein
MRTFGVIAASLALLVVATASAAGQATIRVTKVKPLTVAGSHFRAREHVKVVATLAGTSEVRYATATLAGSFTVTFTNSASFDPCSDDGFLRVVRKGGVTLSVKLLSERMCPVASSGEGMGSAP